ncbi:hypothetical protein FSY75_22075 [Streptomyces sp. TR1341]|uniref:hypothetical protein n=1 Tax=Streptomyces sp. TR1341 TaxID=2601266 RepID=UPI00138AF90B|nr:hypothetical protein [Streptomyces sp. TR1341]
MTPHPGPYLTGPAPGTGSDRCRINASITYAADDETEKILVASPRTLVAHAGSTGRRPRRRCPSPA